MKKLITLCRKNIHSIFLMVFCMTVLFTSCKAQAFTFKSIGIDNSWTSSDYILDSQKNQYYKVTLPGDGKLSVTLQSWINIVAYKLWNEDLTKTYTSSALYKGSESEPSSDVMTDMYLKAGTYYIEILQYTGYTGYSYKNTGEYRLKASFTNGFTNEAEPNDTARDAIMLQMHSPVTGMMWEDDKYDYYEFNVSEAGTVTVRVSSSINYISYGLRNSDQTSVKDLDGNDISDANISKGSESDPVVKDLEFHLDSGSYYFFLTKFTGYTGTSYTNTGTYTVEYTSLSPDYTDDDDEEDYDDDDDEDEEYYTVDSLSITGTTKIVAGTSVQWGVSYEPDYATDPSFTWSSSNKAVATVSSTGKVKAKKAGKVTISVEYSEDGVDLSDSRTIYVLPKKTSKPAAKKSGTRKAKITWKKQAGVKGYQVQYSRQKSFTDYQIKTVNGKTTYTITGLTKNKTYYVRVRAYYKSGSKNYYGAWSSKRSFKV